MKICIATGSRAEYGVLQSLINQLCDDNDFDVTLLVMGSHLAPEFGHTLDLIERRDWLRIETVETLTSSDTPVGVCKSMGLGLLGIPEILTRLEPDLLLVEGDRYETFIAALAAYTLGIPIIHISGGDVTAGSLDDGYRDCISRLASLHFPDTELAAGRLRGMGVLPEMIYCGGCLSLDGLECYDGPREDDWLVVLHPNEDIAGAELMMLANTLYDHTENLRFSSCCPDAGGRDFNAKIMGFCMVRLGPLFISKETRHGFLKRLASSEVIIGNSSSGIVEAPTLGTPSVNIGTRQLGRPMASSIVQAEPTQESIRAAIRQATEMDTTDITLAYTGGNVAEKIKERIKAWHTNS